MANPIPVRTEEIRTILLRHQAKGFSVDSAIFEKIKTCEQRYSLTLETQEEYLKLMWPSMDRVRPLTPKMEPRTLKDCANRLVNFEWSFDKLVEKTYTWFQECIDIDRDFNLERFGWLILTELNDTEQQETPLANYAICDGTHRSLVLAKKLIRNEIAFEPIKAFFLTPKQC